MNFSFPDTSSLFGSRKEPAEKCTQCHVEFGFQTFKYNCRKCGLQFCDDCTKNRCIIPQEEIAQLPTSSWNPVDMIASTENDFRKPQRVCYSCYFALKDQQEELRLAVSKANQHGVVSNDSSIPHLPSAIDFYLDKEINKAALIVSSFKTTMDGQGIPRRLLAMAKGVVFFTIVKLGFIFTGRYGTGLIVSRLPNGKWSAPSAVQMTGVGWGLQVGAELTTVMLILATDMAVNAFKSSAQISVGAEFGVSVGPVGRSLETDVSAGQQGAAHAFSYAQSKGLFVGASLEASGIAARPDVNRAFYGQDVPISALLEGTFESPRGAETLYAALDELMMPSRSATPLATEMSQLSADVGAGASGSAVDVEVPVESLHGEEKFL